MGAEFRLARTNWDDDLDAVVRQLHGDAAVVEPESLAQFVGSLGAHRALMTATRVVQVQCSQIR